VTSLYTCVGAAERVRLPFPAWQRCLTRRESVHSRHWFWNEESSFPFNGKFQQGFSLCHIPFHLSLQGTGKESSHLCRKVGNAKEVDDFGKGGGVILPPLDFVVKPACGEEGTDCLTINIELE
jgi:hypothetical protein